MTGTFTRNSVNFDPKAIIVCVMVWFPLSVCLECKGCFYEHLRLEYTRKEHVHIV